MDLSTHHSCYRVVILFDSVDYFFIVYTINAVVPKTSLGTDNLCLNANLMMAVFVHAHISEYLQRERLNFGNLQKERS